ncbi:hypothetical protein [Hydrogenophaga aromaticivorans]|uniref:hypothetical protein n=1 Tax=Hydrogenophaga aromaticivorans TaxID=2610898 RepID=UPI001FFD7142|nr:hypothetical protein [Hydrogenophaga aromaticivorans]
MEEVLQIGEGLSKEHAIGNGLDLQSIHPRQGAKFSPNLYRWLTLHRRKHRVWTSRVYTDKQGVLWIGMLDLGDLIGSRLYGVLCNGSQEESCCWVRTQGLVEVTDFWPRYMRDGRCAIDTGHEQFFLGDETRWKTDGEERECQWCGHSQVMSRRTETIEHKVWVTA